MALTPKPFLSIDDQIDRLKERGIAITDDERAKRCLRRIGYYRLSAYWYPFREFQMGPLQAGTSSATLRSDVFVAGTSFDDVINFYVFDKQIRVLLSDGLERIEIAMRAKICDLLGKRDPRAHRNPFELDGEFSRKLERNSGQPKHQSWLRKQDSHFARSREDFAEHFRNRYPTFVAPIWVACEVWDWGMLSHFFAGMKQSDKDQIAQNFGPLNGRQLETWLRAMNDVRNICAHHSRLWNRGLKVIPRLPRQADMPELSHLPRGNQSLSRLYTVLLMMRVMLRHIHPTNSNWHRRLVDHVLSGGTASPIIGASAAGFPVGWETEPIWA